MRTSSVEIYATALQRDRAGQLSAFTLELATCGDSGKGRDAVCATIDDFNLQECPNYPIGSHYTSVDCESIDVV